MTKMIQACVAALVLTLSLPATATEVFRVSSSVYHKGELIESPVMVVEAGKKAQMTVGENFRYELVVVPNSDDTVTLQTLVGIGEATVSPALTVFYDKQAAVEVGETKLNVLVSRH